MESQEYYNGVCLIFENVLEHTTMFHKHKMKKTMNSSLARVLHQMIKMVNFIPQLVGWFCSKCWNGLSTIKVFIKMHDCTIFGGSS